MATPYTGNVTVESGFDANNNIQTSSLFDANTGTQSGAHIAFPGNTNIDFPGETDPNWSYGNTVDSMRAAITDYIRMRLGDGIVDVELDKEHYEMGITQALIKYRQRAGNSVEESYAHLKLMPETQEYILPKEVQTVRAVYRRGIGSVTGTTASQFEPFASGYLNTYMLVAGRVGGLTNYELFVDYQKLAMKMFGGFMNFTFNPTTKKLTVVRKMPFKEPIHLQNNKKVCCCGYTIPNLIKSYSMILKPFLGCRNMPIVFVREYWAKQEASLAK